MKKYLFVFLLSLCCYGPSNASDDRGGVRVQISFQDKIGKLEWDSPIESLLSFKRDPKNETQRAEQKKMLELLSGKASEMFVFEPALHCKFNKDDLIIKNEANLRNVQASFHIQCDESPLGSNLRIRAQKTFPKLKQINLILLLDHLQKTVMIDQAHTDVPLK